MYRDPREIKVEVLWAEEFSPLERRSPFLSFTRKLITVVQKKKQKKNKNPLKFGSEKRELVKKRYKRAEKICPFKIIILKTKHHKKVGRVVRVGRVGREGWSARTHPCFVP